MAKIDTYREVAGSLEAIGGLYGELIQKAAETQNLVLVGVLGAILNMNQYASASVGAAVTRMEQEKPQHPLAVWSNN